MKIKKEKGKKSELDYIIVTKTEGWEALTLADLLTQLQEYGKNEKNNYSDTVPNTNRFFFQEAINRVIPTWDKDKKEWAEAEDVENVLEDLGVSG